MRVRHIALSAVFAAGVAALPLSAADAQYYYSPMCNPIPLSWPFCVAGAVVYGVGTVVTAPFRAVAPRPYYYGPPPYGPPPYGPPPYGPPPPYGSAPPAAAAAPEYGAPPPK
jgi:hypothetical protein